MTTHKPINISKVKTTRGGYPVHIYEVLDGRIYGRYFEQGRWWAFEMPESGMVHGDRLNEYDLVEEKTWRAWGDNEGPKRLMVRWASGEEEHVYVDGNLAQEKHLVRAGRKYLFKHATWLREDGSESRCGIEE